MELRILAYTIGIGSLGLAALSFAMLASSDVTLTIPGFVFGIVGICGLVTTVLLVTNE